MDSLRVFTTFTHQNSSLERGRKKVDNRPLDKNGMRKRLLDEKPFVSDSEILKKLNKAKDKTMGPVSGQKLGVGFLEGDEKSSSGDIGSNNPNDSNTTEKLKKMLHSGAVNFSSKEKDILAKILA